MRISSKKLTYIVGIAIMLLAFAIVMGRKAPLLNMHIMTNKQSKEPSIVFQNGILNPTESNTNSDFQNLVWKTPEQRREFDAWIENNGYTKKSRENSDYVNYSIETLQRLVDSGDVKAMLVLGKKMYVTPGQGFNSAKRLYRQAAIYGSTNAINKIGFLTYTHQIAGSIRPLTEDEERGGWLAALSWYELAKLRGDRRGLTMINAQLPYAKVTLTPEDWSQIRENGKKLYQTLREQRLAMGLGEFDNTEPEGVKAYYDYFQSTINPELRK